MSNIRPPKLSFTHNVHLGISFSVHLSKLHESSYRLRNDKNSDLQIYLVKILGLASARFLRFRNLQDDSFKFERCTEKLMPRRTLYVNDNFGGRILLILAVYTFMRENSCPSFWTLGIAGLRYVSIKKQGCPPFWTPPVL